MCMCVQLTTIGFARAAGIVGIFVVPLSWYTTWYGLGCGDELLD